MMKTKTRIFIVLLLLVIAGVTAWFLLRAGWARKEIRNVLLISIDTCRADHLSCYGFRKKTTPNIDRLAAESVLFENAYTPIPLTLPAHSSMLTGTYPPYHKVHDNLNYRLGESNVTIAEILRKYGCTTVAIISAFVLDSQFGTGQGFEIYNDDFEKPLGPPEKKNERRGDEASRFACSYLEKYKDKPFFLFLHYYDPHTDYDPPEPFATTYADDLYTGEIAYTDHCIAQVIEKLKSLELYDSTLIIIVGDHGEMLGEHGESEHGYYIYQSATRIPFIIRPPGHHKPKKIDDVVSLVDVVPTILGYLGIPIPAHVQGRDLSGYWRKLPSAPERYVYTESLTPTKFGCNPLLGLVGQRYEYIQTTRPELYDLPQDPLEENNLVEKEAKRARLMRGQLQELRAKLVSYKRTDSKVELDEAVRRRLESLGYVESGSLRDDFVFDPDKKDAKDLIEFYENNQRVTYLSYYERYAEARDICEKMLSEWPEMPNTYFLLTKLASTEGKMAETIEHGTKYLAMIAGTVNLDLETSSFSPIKPLIMTHQLIAKAYYKLGMFDKAGKHWTEILRMKSDWPNAHDELAAVYFQQGKFDQAAKHWTTALQLKPGWPEVHNNLAGALYKQGKTDEAVKHWTEALRLRPDWIDIRNNLDKLAEQKKRDKTIAQFTKILQRNPDDPYTHDKLATALYQQGKIDEAIEHWTEAVRLKPDWAEAHNNIGGAYYKQGEFDQAVKHWAEAVRLKPDWPEAHNNLAGAFYEQGKIDEAIAHCTEALRLKPDWTEVRNNLDKMAQRKKREEAAAEYIEILQRNPDDPDIHDELAGVLYRQGKIDQAIKYWTEVVRLTPDRAEAHNSLATAFYRQGNIEQAIKHWAEAVRLKPDWAEALNNLAWALATVEDEELRNPAEAVRLAERACELTDYKQPGMLDTLGVAYAAVGRFADAVKTAEKAIVLARDAKQEKLAEDIRSRLELYKMNKPYRD